MYITGISRNPDAVPTPTSGKVNFFYDSTNNGMASLKLDDGSITPLGVTTTDPGDYLGAWNPNTNTPTIVSWTGVQDQFYIVSEDATSDVGIDDIGQPKAGSAVVFDWGLRTSSTAPAGTVQSVNWKVWIVVIDADDIDDTSTTNKYTTQVDIDRLVNTSWTNTGDQDLSTYQLLSEKWQVNWYASLLWDWKVPASQLPSYVDDVEEYATLWDFPAVGETGKIYVALDTNLTYRWSGSVYVSLNDVDLTDYLNKTTDTYLEDIIAWDNITIDKTDPKNPVVNASGGTPFLRSQFRYSTLNIVTSDLLAEDLNRTQMFYTWENTDIVKVNVRCYSIGSNPNTATLNLTVNGNKVLTSDLTLATGLVSSVLVQNTALVDGDEIKREVITATGSWDVLDGYVEVILW